jgi:hypothetical protein
MSGSSIFNGQDGESESGGANPNNRTTVRVYQVLIWWSLLRKFIITICNHSGSKDQYWWLFPFCFAIIGFSASSDWNEPNII